MPGVKNLQTAQEAVNYLSQIESKGWKIMSDPKDHAFYLTLEVTSEQTAKDMLKKIGGAELTSYSLSPPTRNKGWVVKINDEAFIESQAKKLSSQTQALTGGVRDEDLAINAAINIKMDVGMGYRWEAHKRKDGSYTLRSPGVDKQEVQNDIKRSKFPDFEKFSFHQGKTKKESYAEISDPAIIDALGNFNEKKLKKLGTTPSVVTGSHKLIQSSIKQEGDFTLKETLTAKEASGAFSHSVTKETKTAPLGIGIEDKYKHEWFVKLIPDKPSAEREVLAQEFFRLFEPSHPKTRVKIDNQGNIFVASKAVPGFNPVEKMSSLTFNNNLKSGDYKGLGDVTVLALLLNEGDLKLGNLGVDENNRIIKIDGDRCFISVRKPIYEEKTKISTATIECLPMPPNYEVFNWLEYREEGRVNIKPPDAYMTLFMLSQKWAADNSPANFRAEVNTMLLKTLLFPVELAKEMVNHYISDTPSRDKLIETFLSRQDMMRKAALHIASFQELLDSPIARQITAQFISQLESFNMTGKTKLTDNVPNHSIQRSIENEFFKLRSDAILTKQLSQAENSPEPSPSNSPREQQATSQTSSAKSNASLTNSSSSTESSSSPSSSSESQSRPTGDTSSKTTSLTSSDEENNSTSSNPSKRSI